MIYSLSEKEFEEKAKTALIEICGTDHPNPYVNPFTSKMDHKRILCPYDHIPDDELILQISKVAMENGESGFYLTVYDRPTEEIRRFPYHWYISFDEIKIYKELIGACQALPTVVFSPNATWGIVADFEGMGILGVTDILGAQIEANLPDPQQDALEFIRLYKWFRDMSEGREKKVDFRWLPELLDHVYGKELATEFFNEGRMDLDHSPTYVMMQLIYDRYSSDGIMAFHFISHNAV